ncbi:hypothetical protein DVH24_035421 [Malus domestica]|uniref:Uncharacterized protein n=1 Tax=Malus domestica TaxID=3750 RepID=A0A498J7K3_MALDO|nr:hypothetical protein DVH24_035421 [Malus domestica]
MEVTMWMALATTIFTTMVAVASSAVSTVTFVFGDSLTEVGNNNYLSKNYPWYGVDYAGTQATGRFTNGRTIGDIICTQKLGITSPPPYLSLAQNDDALLKGVNYVSGGAGILNDTGLYFIQRMLFDDQIQNFNKTKEAIKAKIGTKEVVNLLIESLCIFSCSNDYVNNYLQPFSADCQQYTYDEFVELLIGTLERQFKHDIVHFGPRPRPHGFVSGNSHENFPVGHLSWDCSRTNSLNFGVPMEHEANELPKGLMLGRDGNIHIRLRGSTPLGDVGCYNPPPLRGPMLYQLGARKMMFYGLGPLGCIPSHRVKSKRGQCLKRVNE